MKLLAMLLSILAVAASPAISQSTVAAPQKASTIVDMALSDAGASGKNVMVIFHASWCSWCRKLEAVLDKADVRSVMSKYYVIARLDVLERGEKKVLENPGGGEYLKELSGENSGLPFYVFLDAKGKKVADSKVMPEQQNIGYPGTKEEVAAFANLLKTTAPRMSEEELNGVLKNFGK